MYSQLVDINKQPQPFEFYTTETLWNDPHISKMMLASHLNEEIDQASRKKTFVDRSIDWISSHFSLDTDTHICDFGCGPGLYTLELALRGAQVTGVDFSQRSITYARNAANEKGASIHYVLQNYLQYETEEKYDLITMIMCDFCVFSPQQRRLFLQKCHRLLKEDGALLFDGYLLPAFDKKWEGALYEHRLMDGFWSDGDYYGFLNSYRYLNEKVSLDQYTIVEAQRTWRVYNWLQYYSLEALRSAIEANGLRIDETYSDVAGGKFSEKADEFAVVVRKQA